MAGSVRDRNNGGGSFRLPGRDCDPEPPPPPPAPPAPPAPLAAAAALCWALKWKRRRGLKGGERLSKGCERAKESDNNKLMLLFIKCDESVVSAGKCNYIPFSLHSSMPFPFHLHEAYFPFPSICTPAYTERKKGTIQMVFKSSNACLLICILHHNLITAS